MRPSVAIIPLLLLAGCNEAEVPDPIRPVLTAPTEVVDTETFGPFTGTVEARFQTQLGFQVPGRIVARDVYVGNLVVKGQRLAALDPTVIQFALTRAQADVADSKAQLANAEGVATRQRLLVQGGNTSQATLDNATASRDTAKARLEQSQASLRLAEDQIGYTELRSNFDGVVTAWSAEVGQYVANGQSVVTVARPDVREAVVDIPDDLIGQVHPDMPFSVRLQAVPAITADAIVREIGPAADSATRSHRVRLTLRSPSEAFRIGTVVSVSLVRTIASRTMVPATAVVEEGTQRYVWILAKDGKSVARRSIGVTGTDGDKVIVGSGLGSGDEVVTAGVHSLKDGQAVAGPGTGIIITKAKRTSL